MSKKIVWIISLNLLSFSILFPIESVSIKPDSSSSAEKRSYNIYFEECTGQNVVIKTYQSEKYKGTLLMVSSDTLFVSQNGQIQKILITELSSIEVKKKMTKGKITATVVSAVAVAMVFRLLIFPSMSQ